MDISTKNKEVLDKVNNKLNVFVNSRIERGDSIIYSDELYDVIADELGLPKRAKNDDRYGILLH